MATLFILLVLAYFVIAIDVSVIEKLVLAVLCGAAALIPSAFESTALAAAIAQAVLGVYICLRMTYARAQR